MESTQLLKKGMRVWIPNPYPDNDDSYRQHHLPPAKSGAPVWVPGSVVKQVGDDQTVVTTEWEPKIQVEMQSKLIYPRNVVSNVDDMVSFGHLHEAELLNNLQVRFRSVPMQQIYTMAGPILISVNPYKLIVDENNVGIYDPVYIKKYQQRMPKDILDTLPAAQREKAKLPPHVFDVADDMLIQYKREQNSQSVVISGESGAGKTECTKQIMQYLTTCAADHGHEKPAPSADAPPPHPRKRSGSLGSVTNPFQGLDIDDDGDAVAAQGDQNAIERKLLRTNPVLEALGNAKTVRNDNSSRFGKFIQIFLETDLGSNAQRISGGLIEDFLLEKSRVVSQMHGERNYHVFYQMIAGSTPEQKDKFRLKPIESYRYLNPNLQGEGRSGHKSSSVQPIATTAGVMDDKAEFHELEKAMDIIGLTGDRREQLFSILSGILALGNITFEPAGDGCAVAGASDATVQDASALLGIDIAALKEQLVVKERTAGAGAAAIVSPLTVDQAFEGLDALAKGVYGKLFKWVVKSINLSLNDSPEATANHMYIGILDIFGFEVFEKNSFEQLCINFANEKLQQLFTSFVFKLEQQVYMSENINFSEIEFTDNQAIIDLIEKRPLGIFSLLDEACLFPRSTDESFLQKCTQSHKANVNFEKSGVKFGPSFIVKHSAEDVRYSVKDFLLKNRDRLNDNITALLNGSSVGVLAELFDTPAAAGGNNRKSSARGGFTGSNAFLGSKFKDDINKLMTKLRTTTPHFVRCLKPNSQKKSDYMDPSMVLHQLRYLGVLDSIRIRHSGFSYRTLFKDFYDRFVILAAGVAVDNVEGVDVLKIDIPDDADIKALCEVLVRHLWEVAGFSKDTLNSMIQMGKTKIFLRKQAIESLEALREVKLEHMYAASIKIQGLIRMHICKSRRKALKTGFTRAQAAWRSVYYRARWIKHREAHRRVRGAVQVFVAKCRAQKRKKALLMVQRFARNNIHRVKWLRVKRGLGMLHTLVRGFTVRQHVMRMVKAVQTLQRSARVFLFKNRQYWSKVRAALLMQSLWRGHVLRVQRDDVMEHLEIKRGERFKVECIRRIQALWKSYLIRRRYDRIVSAAKVLQYYARSLAFRARFKRIQASTRLIQRVSRGFLARNRVRQVITDMMVEDEKWKLKTVQERELLQLATIHHTSPTLFEYVCANMNRGMNSSTVAKASKMTTRSAARKKSGGVLMTKLLDVDIMVGSFEVYPQGWCKTVGELENALGKQGARIEGISLGVSHSLCLTDSGDVYSWGWGERGQLGHGSFEMKGKPQKMDLFATVENSGALCNNGSTVLGNTTAGSTISRSNAANPLIPRDIGGRIKMKQLCCGDDHSMALSTDGKVFTWGAGGRGQLGHGDMSNNSMPRQVEGLRKVSEIACGGYHSVALIMAGSVYTWGSGPQLGHGVFAGRGDNPIPMAIKTLSKHRVRHIACGWGYTVAVSHGGDVFSWGNNESGQLGIGDETKSRRLVPTIIDTFNLNKRLHTRIVQITCGPRHCAAIGATGLLYTWGSGMYGQLGHGDYKGRSKPTLVKRLSMRKLKQVVCGCRTTMAISDVNEIYGWGCVGTVKRASEATPGGDLEAKPDKFVQSTCVPVEVPIKSTASRAPVKLCAAFSQTVSFVGLTYQQKILNGSYLNEPLFDAVSECKMNDAINSMLYECPEDGQSGSDHDLPFLGQDGRGADDDGKNRFLSISIPSSSGGSGVASSKSPSASGRSRSPLRGSLGKVASVFNSPTELIDWSEVDSMSNDQLKKLIKELVELSKKSVIMENDDRTRNEKLLAFLHREKSKSPVKRAKEKSWNDQFTSKLFRHPGAHGGKTKDSSLVKRLGEETEARSEMLLQQQGLGGRSSTPNQTAHHGTGGRRLHRREYSSSSVQDYHSGNRFMSMSQLQDNAALGGRVPHLSMWGRQSSFVVRDHHGAIEEEEASETSEVMVQDGESGGYAMGASGLPAPPKHKANFSSASNGLINENSIIDLFSSGLLVSGSVGKGSEEVAPEDDGRGRGAMDGEDWADKNYRRDVISMYRRHGMGKSSGSVGNLVRDMDKEEGKGGETNATAEAGSWGDHHDVVHHPRQSLEHDAVLGHHTDGAHLLNNRKAAGHFDERKRADSGDLETEMKLDDKGPGGPVKQPPATETGDESFDDLIKRIRSKAVEDVRRIMEMG